MSLKYPFHSVLCFYYVFLTPKAADYKESLENYLFEVIFVSLVQAGVIFGILTYFELEWTVRYFVEDLTGYMPQTWMFSAFVGAWTLCGGLQYPYLNESLKEDEEKKKAERNRQQDAEMAAVRRAEKNRAVAKAANERREAEIRQWDDSVERNGPVKSLQTLERQLNLHKRNPEGKPLHGLSIFKDTDWMEKEIALLKTFDEVKADQKAGEIDSWLKKVDERGVEKCLKTLESILQKYRSGQNPADDFLIFQDPQWMEEEIARLRSLRS